MVVLEHLGECRGGAEVVEGQGEQTDPGLGSVAFALVLDAQPGRGRDLPNDREVACPDVDETDRLACVEDAEPELPGRDAPCSKVVPVALQHGPGAVFI